MSQSDNSFSFVALPQRLGWPTTQSGIRKVEVFAIGHGPDANISKERRFSGWRDKKDEGGEHEWVGLLEQAVKEGSPIVLKGYKSEAPNGFYWNLTGAEPWNAASAGGDARPGEVAQAQSFGNQEQATAPGAAQAPRGDQREGLARWAIATVLNNLDKFPEVPINDKAERSEWIRASAHGLARMARDVATKL